MVDSQSKNPEDHFSLTSMAIPTSKVSTPLCIAHWSTSTDCPNSSQKDRQITTQTKRTRISQTPQLQPQHPQCVCHSWKNWRNLFITILAVCSVIFIFSDLYYLTHLELAALRLRTPPPSVPQSTFTFIQTNASRHNPWIMNNLNLDYYHNEFFMEPAMDSFTAAKNFMLQQRLFSRELQVGNISDDLLLCTRRWKMELSKHQAGTGHPDLNLMLSQNPFHISVGPVQGRHLFKEDFEQVKSMQERRIVRNKGDNMTFDLQYTTGINVHVAIMDIRLLPEYQDVEHEGSDNGIVLDTSRRSNMHHWRAPLQALLKSKCRYPIPKHYYLTMHPYSDRHTTAKRQICRRADEVHSRRRLCPKGLPPGSVYYQRSINGQCTQNKASFLPPQRNSFYCTTNSELVTELFNEHITERQSYLKDAHCDTQRRICQTCLRRSCWTESRRQTDGNDLIEDLTQSWDWMHDEVISAVKERYQKCCGVSCYSNPSCQEYYNPACQRYTINQPEMDEICLQGQTLKFTLNPEFDLNNGSYLCHLRYNPPSHLYIIRTWLTIDNRWQTQPVRMTVTAADSTHRHRAQSNSALPEFTGTMNHVQRHAQEEHNLLMARQNHGQLWLWNHAVKIEHHSKMPIWSEGIVQGESVTDQMTWHRLKTPDEFGLLKPELQKHRDEKYVVMQVTRPFLYNTETWGNQSCHINISHIHRSQPIYAESTGLPVTLTSPVWKSESGAFEYVMDHQQSPSSYIELRTNTDSHRSLLQSAFCSYKSDLIWIEQLGYNQSVKPKPSGTLMVQAGRRPQIIVEQTQSLFNGIACTTELIWRITVTGWVTSKPAFVELEIYQHTTPSNKAQTNSHLFPTRHVLRQENLIILPSEADAGIPKGIKNDKLSGASGVPFSFALDLRVTTLPRTIVKALMPFVYIELSSCTTSYTLQISLNKDNQLEPVASFAPQFARPRDKSNVQKTSKNMERTYLPFILICTAVGLLYLILLIIYGIVRAYASSSTSPQSSTCSCVCREHQTGPPRITNPHSSTEYTNVQMRRRAPSTSISSATSLLSTPHHSSLTAIRMTTTRKVLLMFYLCFRVFYTFLFTISVALSLMLSIESNAAREFTVAVNSPGYHAVRNAGNFFRSVSPTSVPNAFVISPIDLENRWRGAKSWMFEAARMEDFAQSELLRQFQSSNVQIAKCGEMNWLTSAQLAQQIQQAGEQYKGWLDPRRDRFTLSGWSAQMATGREQSPMINRTWSSSPTDLHHQTIDRTTWSLLENSNWLPYLDSVDGYLRKVRDNLDSRVIDRWSPYDRLLANLLANTWIAPARRALNHSWLGVKNVGPDNNNFDFSSLTDSDNYYHYYYEDRSDAISGPSNLNKGRSKESRALKLTNFLGVPQPAHARLTGARMWNSFRSLVPGLPSRFYFDVSNQLLDHPHSSASSGWSKKLATRLFDQRYMLSNEDWKHVAGGYLGDNPNQAYRYLQNLDNQALRSDATAATDSKVYTHKYFLNLTQVRLILLLLDAVIILARCFQTFQFMHKVWFGSVARLHVELIQVSPKQSVQPGHVTIPVFSDQFRGAYRDAANFLHPVTCSDLTESKKDGLTQSESSEMKAETARSLSPVIGSHCGAKPQGSFEMRLYKHTPGPTRLILRPTELRSPMDGSTGRLTACYCCLDAHYLLIIVGIGLLLVGLVLLWATDRHVRPGWLLAKTSVYARSRALEDCRLRTNAILKTIQPTYLNQNVMLTIRRSMHTETERLKQLYARFKHEKTQIARQYFSELCALERNMANAYQTNQAQTTDNLWKLTSPSACTLFDSKMEFSHLWTQDWANRSHRVYSSRKGQQAYSSKLTVEFPACTLTPIVPATYAEGYTSRMLRIAQTMSRVKQRTSNFTLSTLGSSPLTVMRNFSNPITAGSEDPIVELDQLSVSFGSLAALTNALHRLLLTSLTVALAMGGFLACLHLAKLVAQQTYLISIRKINWITFDPPNLLSKRENSQS